jgi:hypothetical protein
MSDKYVDAARQEGSPARGRESTGVKPKIRTITFETAVADAAGDIRRLFTVGAHEIPVRCQILCDAIAGATDIDLGLYRPGVDGVVVDKDALMDGTDIAAGKAFSDNVDGLSALGVEERGIRTFQQIASDVVATDIIGHIPNDSYDFCMTLVSEITAVGTITVILETIEQQ